MPLRFCLLQPKDSDILIFLQLRAFDVSGNLLLDLRISLLSLAWLTPLLVIHRGALLDRFAVLAVHNDISRINLK